MTAEQDARRWMKEFISFQEESELLGTWDAGIQTEARIDFTNDMLNRFADAFCDHAEHAEVGTLQIFVLPASAGVYCVNCLPPPVNEEYLYSTECDWCRGQTEWFTEVVFTFPAYAMHINGNVCDNCLEKLRPSAIMN